MPQQGSFQAPDLPLTGTEILLGNQDGITRDIPVNAVWDGASSAFVATINGLSGTVNVPGDATDSRWSVQCWLNSEPIMIGISRSGRLFSWSASPALSNAELVIIEYQRVDAI